MQAYQQFAVYPVRDKLPVFSDGTESQVMRTVNRNTRLPVIRREGPHYIVRILGQIGFVTVEEVSANRQVVAKLGDGIEGVRRVAGFDRAVPNALSGMVRVDFFTRLIGFVIDIVLITILQTVAFFVLTPVLIGPMPLLLGSSINLGIWFGYFWLLGASAGTVGMIITGQHLVDDRTGRAPDLQRSALRALVSFVSAIPLFLGYFWALWNDGRTWHDMAAGTSVVKYR
ncbi:MAG: RDD family protein [Chloroflexi bacterium]|nr:RDD family protein [Chloroflexota bacterium]